MHKLYVLPGLVAAFALVLAFSVGANYAVAATTETTGTTQNATCPSGMARVSLTTHFHGPAGKMTIPVQGGPAIIEFVVADGCNLQLSLVSYKAPSATFSAETASQQVLFDSATGTFAAGEHSLSVDLPNCFFQLDFVFGAPLTTLGPAGSNNFYGAQGRLISAWNFGTGSCTAAAETTPATGSTGNQTPVTTVTTTQPVTTTTTVIPAGPITWAPGFGPGGVVASVQAAPATPANTSAVLGTQTGPVSVASLPSTSTDTGDNNGAIALGIASIALGLVLLRAARPVSLASRLD